MSSGVSRREGLARLEVVALAAVIALFGSLFPVVAQQVREQVRQTQCRNQLKMVALACHNYLDVHRMFPPGWIEITGSADSGPGYGWQTMLLPFVEASTIFNKVNFQQPMPDTATPLLQSPVGPYRCPSDRTQAVNSMRGNYGTSNYSGNAGFEPFARWAPSPLVSYWPGAVDDPVANTGMFARGSLRRLRDVTDGMSNTFLAGERSLFSAAGIWAGVRSNQNETDQVTTCAAGNEINSGIAAFSSVHAGGVNMAMCDGAVQFIKETIQSRPGSGEAMGVFQKLAGYKDGQIIGVVE